MDTEIRLNRDIQTRDTIIFGSYKESRYGMGGGYAPRFHASRQRIIELMNKGFIDPKEAQNDSPTTQEFLDMTDGLDDTVVFEGYTISDTRGDYRVTIDTLEIDIPSDDAGLISFMVEQTRHADEFDLDPCGDHFHLRAWWD